MAVLVAAPWWISLGLTFTTISCLSPGIPSQAWATMKNNVLGEWCSLAMGDRLCRVRTLT